MRALRPDFWWAVLLIALLPVADAARAEFVQVEDFESLELAPIDDQNGWTAPSDSSTVALDPVDGSNQVLSVVTESTFLFRPTSLPDATTRMLFLRFRLDGQLNFSLGMADASYPTQFDDFDVELSVTNATNTLRINDDGNYEVLSVLQLDTWYNCWLLIDNTSEETQVWLHERAGQGAEAADQLDADGQTLFHFRNPTAGELRRFFIKTGGGSGPGGPLYIDDIYLENSDALNLTNPTATTTPVSPSARPPGYSLAPNFPNPFNPTTKIAFALADDQPVRLAVYNLAGNQVAVLVDAPLPAGRHEVAWNGCDRHGRPLASGTYVYRIAAGTFRESRVMTLVK